MKTTVSILAVALLSLFAGGAINILFILIPFWKTLEPASVMKWFNDFGGTIGITMMPVEITSLLISIYAFILARKTNSSSEKSWLLINISNIFVLAIFFIYFLPVNLRFLHNTMPPQNVSAELLRWQYMHIIRTVFILFSAGMSVKAVITENSNKF